MTEEEKGFVIKDRRTVAEDGKETAEDNQQEAASPEEPEPFEEKEAAADEAGEEDFALPEINFATFVFSLNSSALLHLGVIEDPATGQKTKNLALARQTIDILGILEEKTVGNLTSEEDTLLKNILHELRLMFVKEKG